MAAKARAIEITTLSCASSTGSPDILCATIRSRAALTAMPTSACTSILKDLPHFMLVFSSCKPCDSSKAPHLPSEWQHKIARAYNALADVHLELRRRLFVIGDPVLPSSIDVSSLTLKSFLFVMTSSTFSGPCCVIQGVSFAF